MTESNTPTSHPFFGLLSKISNNLIGITMLCYGAGFAITNLYLGSMGIVTFDILRSRYILAGLLFLFFVGAIIYLANGLIQTLRKNLQKSYFVVLRDVIWYSIINVGVLYFVITAFGIFGSTTGAHNFSPTQLTQSEIPWSDWLAQAPLSTLRTTSTLFVIVMAAAIIFLTVFIIINPKDKDGKPRTRRQILKEEYNKIKESKGKIYIPLIIVFVLIYFLNLSISLLSFYVAGKLAIATKTTFTFLNGWSHLFNAIVIVYTIIAMYLTMTALFPPVTTDNDSYAMSNHSAIIYLIALGIIIIVPLYILRVYPVLPQQIGGGQLIKVEIVISDNTIEPQFNNPQINTYLIDRTSATSFFMLQKNDESEYKIVEIKNDLIQSITYALSP